jgi:hypothetical protein
MAPAEISQNHRAYMTRTRYPGLALGSRWTAPSVRLQAGRQFVIDVARILWAESSLSFPMMRKRVVKAIRDFRCVPCLLEVLGCVAAVCL